MKAVIEIDSNKLDNNYLEMLQSRFKKNVTEIVLTPHSLTLEEFDKKISCNFVVVGGMAEDISITNHYK